MTVIAHKIDNIYQVILGSFPYSDFNGKEKDYESGFHYYGARYYWSEVLTGWLSVDPMADKYPSISPYAYCAWNPVKLVDPDGKEVGDYYDKYGNYLGWDGKHDFNLNIVTDKESIGRIKSNKVVPKSEVSVAVSTNYFVLQRCEEILDNSIRDNAQHEYGTTMQGSFSADIVQGQFDKTVLPPPPGYENGNTVSIHSHPDANESYGRWIEYMSEGVGNDAQAFQSFDLNIIVGQREDDTEKGAAFYGRQPRGDYSRKTPIVTISKTALHKMSQGKMNAIYKQYRED